MEREEKIRFIEALNTYYKLKKGYDSSFMTEKQKIIKKKDIGWKEKRRMFYQLRPKCINCKRPVGSIFKTVYNNGERYLSAKCGDIQEPCKLKIQINLGAILNINEDIRANENEIHNVKLKIITVCL